MRPSKKSAARPHRRHPTSSFLLHPSSFPVRWLGEDAQTRLLAAGTDAFRLADSPRLWIEKFGAVCLISHAEPVLENLLPEISKRFGAGLQAIYAKRLTHNPSSSNTPLRVLGENPEPLHHVREQGLVFEVDFSAGYSCGLFLDQRENRRRLRAMAPRRVLNCFAFTCSFSVAAASAGATTWNLDISRAALTRGKRNFALNGLDPTAHKFLTDDVLDVLPRLARRGETFDTIILDPPTFSRGRGGRIFRVEDHLPTLIRLAMDCAAPGAKILVSTNCSRLGPNPLLRMIQSVAGRSVAFEKTPPPEDFPAGGASTTVFFQIPPNAPTRQRTLIPPELNPPA